MFRNRGLAGQLVKAAVQSIERNVGFSQGASQISHLCTTTVPYSVHHLVEWSRLPAPRATNAFSSLKGGSGCFSQHRCVGWRFYAQQAPSKVQLEAAKRAADSAAIESSRRWTPTQFLHSLRNSVAAMFAAPRRLVRGMRHRAAVASTWIGRHLPARMSKTWESATKPGAAQKVIALQLDAFWQAHGNKVIALVAFLSIYLMWRMLFGMTTTFVTLSNKMAEYGFLALSIAIASFTYLYFRRQYTISPDAVYRGALVMLNTNPGILEVMGAPVTGSPLRAYVMTGGGLRMKGLLPRWRSRRIQMIFPLTGADRRGLVSLEAKKRNGRYVYKLLAVDVPAASGQEQRLFVEGNDRIYNRGSVVKELRDPFLNAIALKDTYEREDEIDDAAEEAEETRHEQERAAAQALAKPKPLDQGGGLYFYERVYWGTRELLSRIGHFFTSSTPTAASPPSASQASNATKSPQ